MPHANRKPSSEAVVMSHGSFGQTYANLFYFCSPRYASVDEHSKVNTKSNSSTNIVAAQLTCNCEPRGGKWRFVIKLGLITAKNSNVSSHKSADYWRRFFSRGHTPIDERNVESARAAECEDSRSDQLFVRKISDITNKFTPRVDRRARTFRIEFLPRVTRRTVCCTLVEWVGGRTRPHPVHKLLSLKANREG